MSNLLKEGSGDEDKVDAAIAKLAKAGGSISIFADAELIVVEETNMKLHMRLPRGSDYLAAVELAGNSMMGLAVFEGLLCITGINGEPRPRPNTRAKLDALGDLIGRDGINSVINWHQRKAMPELGAAFDHFGPDLDLADPLVKGWIDEHRKERLKKSQGTQS